MEMENTSESISPKRTKNCDEETMVADNTAEENSSAVEDRCSPTSSPKSKDFSDDFPTDIQKTLYPTPIVDKSGTRKKSTNLRLELEIAAEAMGMPIVEREQHVVVQQEHVINVPTVSADQNLIHDECDCGLQTVSLLSELYESEQAYGGDVFDFLFKGTQTLSINNPKNDKVLINNDGNLVSEEVSPKLKFKLKTLEDVNESLNKLVSSQKQELFAANQRMLHLENNNLYRDEVNRLQAIVEANEVERRSLAEELQNQRSHVVRLEGELSLAEMKRSKLEVELRDKEEVRKSMVSIEAKWVEMEGELRKKDEELVLVAELLKQKESDLVESAGNIDCKVEEIDKLKNTVESMNSASKDLESEIKRLTKVNKEEEEKVMELNEGMNDLASECMRLRTENVCKKNKEKVEKGVSRVDAVAESEENSNFLREMAETINALTDAILSVDARLEIQEKTTRNITNSQPNNQISQHKSKTPTHLPNLQSNNQISRHKSKTFTHQPNKDKVDNQKSSQQHQHKHQPQQHQHSQQSSPQHQQVQQQNQPQYHPQTSLPKKNQLQQNQSLLEQNRFFPLQFINNSKPVNNSKPSYNIIKPVRPGPKTYSDVTSGTKKATILSTSMTKGFNEKNFHQKYTAGTATIHKFHGGKARHVRNQIETHLYEERPDAAIVLAGGNDLLLTKSNQISVWDIANQVFDSALLCKKYDVEDICISSVLPRRIQATEQRRKELNDLLRNMCRLHDFIFIDNDAGEEPIQLDKHVSGDGVHLNIKGSDLLAQKFVDVLNSLYSS